MRLIALMLFIISCTVIQQADAQRLLIAEGGKSSYRIVTNAKVGSVEQRAAKELQKYIQLVSGCTLPIFSVEGPASSAQIIVGNTPKLTTGDTDKLGGDGFVIKTNGNTIIIAGGPRKGTLYGVYTFLEEYMGCRALSAGNIIHPRQTSLSLPTPVFNKQVPSFDYRMMFFPDAFDTTYSDWRKVNQVMEGWGLWVHTFEGLVPVSRYFKTNPEYFAFVNGKRDTAQLCPSHPEVKDIIINHLRSIIKGRPHLKFWSVSPNDNQLYCQCQLCYPVIKRERSPMGPLLNLVNGVAVHFPDYIITTLAYGYSEKPPRRIVPAGNVMIMLATASVSNRSVPLKQIEGLPLHDHLKKWSEVTRHLWLWDYVAKFNNFFLPFPNLDVYQPDIKYFAANNVNYLFMQGPGNKVTEFSELKGYLISVLMWNKDADIAAETDVFLKSFYGEQGSVHMKRYLDELRRQATSTQASMLVFERYDEALFTKYLSRDNLSKYKAIFDEAFKAVDSSSIYGKRLQKEYASLLYAELEHDMWEMGSGKRPDVQLRQNLKRRVERWRQLMKKTKVERLSESGISIEDYYRHYEGALNVGEE